MFIREIWLKRRDDDDWFSIGKKSFSRDMMTNEIIMIFILFLLFFTSALVDELSLESDRQ